MNDITDSVNKNSINASKPAIKVLLVEDNPGDALLIKEMLSESESTLFYLEWVDYLSKGIDYLATNNADIVLLDLSLPDSSGSDTFEKMIMHAKHVPIIVLTGLNDENMAVTALHRGLQDYIIKGNVDSLLLTRSIRYAIERKQLEENLRVLQDELEKRVKYRTIELLDANKALREEVEWRMKIEQELLESKSQAELYLDLMGHDISNINQIAMGFLELSIESPALDEETRILISKPLEVLNNSSRLIDNVRKLQKVRAGNTPKKTTDIGQVLLKVKDMHSNIPGRDITINYMPIEGCMVNADEFLTDVFANLLNNSIKHSQGAVIINIMAIKNFYGEDRRIYHKVMIGDNGPGIPDELKALIFNRPLRGATTAKGSGIGLYLVKMLVDSYGGKIWVEDHTYGERSNGSVFIVLLPAAE